MTDKERVRECLEKIIHVKERNDVDMPPSVHTDIEMYCQGVWKAIGEEEVDDIYPEYWGE